MDVVQLNTVNTRPEVGLWPVPSLFRAYWRATSPQVFIEVESHETVDVEDKKSPNHTLPDTESEQEMWEDSDVKNKSVGSMVWPKSFKT
jgi:hypothetical protein